MKMLKEDSNTLNQDIDAFINTFSTIDEVEKNIEKTEENIEVIYVAIKNLGTLQLKNRQKGFRAQEKQEKMS